MSYFIRIFCFVVFYTLVLSDTQAQFSAHFAFNKVVTIASIEEALNEKDLVLASSEQHLLYLDLRQQPTGSHLINLRDGEITAIQLKGQRLSLSSKYAIRVAFNEQYLVTNTMNTFEIFSKQGLNVWQSVFMDSLSGQYPTDIFLDGNKAYFTSFFNAVQTDPKFAAHRCTITRVNITSNKVEDIWDLEPDFLELAPFGPHHWFDIKNGLLAFAQPNGYNVTLYHLESHQIVAQLTRKKLNEFSPSEKAKAQQLRLSGQHLSMDYLTTLLTSKRSLFADVKFVNDTLLFCRYWKTMSLEQEYFDLWQFHSTTNEWTLESEDNRVDYLLKGSDFIDSSRFIPMDWQSHYSFRSGMLIVPQFDADVARWERTRKEAYQQEQRYLLREPKKLRLYFFNQIPFIK